MFSINDIKKTIPNGIQILGVKTQLFDNVKPIHDANLNSLSWIKKNNRNSSELLLSSKAGVIICSNELQLPESILNKKMIIVCDDPKLTFLRLTNKLFDVVSKIGIHISAQIDSARFFSPCVAVIKIEHPSSSLSFFATLTKWEGGHCLN